MAFFTIAEDPEKGEFIPSDSGFIIVSVTPHGGSKKGYSEVVAQGQATESIGVNLDPGLYRIKVNGNDSGERIMWGRTFTVGVTNDADLKKLRNMKTKWAKAINTTRGARWNCQFPGGCSYSATSVMGAVMHEYKEHLGMDPLKAGRQEIKEAVTKATRA